MISPTHWDTYTFIHTYECTYTLSLEHVLYLLSSTILMCSHTLLVHSYWALDTCWSWTVEVTLPGSASLTCMTGSSNSCTAAGGPTSPAAMGRARVLCRNRNQFVKQKTRRWLTLHVRESTSDVLTTLYVQYQQLMC